MEIKPKFKVIYSDEANTFLSKIPQKAKEKILYNIVKSKYLIDPVLFKKLENSEIWEFRTNYNSIQYRLLAFWHTDNETLVIATHGFIKKTQKTPAKEIARAEEIRKIFLNQIKKK